MDHFPSSVSFNRDRDAPKLFYYALVLGILMKEAISSEVLDVFVPYTRSEGSPLFKIHPGSYILLILGALVMPGVFRRASFEGNHALRACLILLFVTALITLSVILRGETGSGSYIIDSLVVGPMTVISLAALSSRQRLGLARWILGLFFANDMVVFAEFATHKYFLPYPDVGEIFRPPGIFNHPLRTGLNSVAALPCIFLLPMPARVRWSLGGILWLGVIVSQARVATLLSTMFMAIAIPVTVMEAIRTRRLSSVTAFVFGTITVILAPAGVGILYLLGALERLTNGFADSSTLARVNIYRIFDYFTLREILFGSSLARANYVATYGLGIPIIESPIVVFIFMFGLFGAIILSAAILYYFISISISGPFLSKLAVVAFLILAFANNSIAQKGETILCATILMFIASTEGARQRRQHWLVDRAPQVNVPVLPLPKVRGSGPVF